MNSALTISQDESAPPARALRGEAELGTGTRLSCPGQLRLELRHAGVSRVPRFRHTGHTGATISQPNASDRAREERATVT
jgi:hypothetical protein